PANPDSLSPLVDFADYRRRMDLLAAKTVTFGVLRRNEPNDGKLVEIAVQPEYRASLGLRMQIGKVAAVRKGGPAERAGVAAVALGDSPKGRGDRIAAVGATDAKGKRTWFANGKTPPEAKSEDAVEPLDPMLLPLQLRRWAAQFPAESRGNLKVDLVVLRETEAEHKEQRTALVLDYDDSYRFNHDILPLSNSPLAVDGLGLAYWVSGVVDDVAADSPPASKPTTFWKPSSGIPIRHRPPGSCGSSKAAMKSGTNSSRTSGPRSRRPCNRTARNSSSGSSAARKPRKCSSRAWPIRIGRAAIAA